MSSTAESRFSFGDDYIEPSENDKIIIEYLGRGKYGVFIQHSEWKRDDPLPQGTGYYMQVGGRLYCVAMVGSLEALMNYCNPLQPILAASNGVWVSEVVSQMINSGDEDPNKYLTPGEIEWWKNNWGPYPGDTDSPQGRPEAE